MSPQTPSARAKAGYPRIPCLDGLRGLAIVSVLYSHGGFYAGFPHFPWWPFDGSPGVSVFFILTGLLVTTIILDERERTGKFSVRNFLVRRALRIWPALYIFLGVTLVLRAIGWIEFADLAWIAAATHWMNLYAGPSPWPLSHMWSLSLQEVFYLVWPLVLTRIRTVRAMAVCGLAIVGWPLLRLLVHGEAAPWPAHLALDNNGMNTIFCGALLALAMREQRLQPLLSRLSHVTTLVVCSAILLALYALHALVPREMAPLLSPLRNVSVLGIVWWCISNPNHLIGKLLAWRPLVYMGAISFSLYLWQQLFLSANSGWICKFPQNIIAAIAVGALSYHCCELPARGLSSRFRNSKGTASEPQERTSASILRERGSTSPALIEPADYLHSLPQ